MKTAKDAAMEFLKKLPDDVSLEDIQYHLYLREKIENSLREIEEGKFFTQEEVDRESERWLEEESGRLPLSPI